LAYAVSFALVAVSADGESIRGYFCAYSMLVVAFRLSSSPLEGNTINTIAFVMSGWVNIAFLASMAIGWRSGNGLLSRGCAQSRTDDELARRRTHFHEPFVPSRPAP
jgi:hypothetical protein